MGVLEHDPALAVRPRKRWPRSTIGAPRSSSSWRIAADSVGCDTWQAWRRAAEMLLPRKRDEIFELAKHHGAPRCHIPGAAARQGQ